MLPVSERTNERLTQLRETNPPPKEWPRRIPNDPIRALMERKDAEFERHHPRNPHTGQFIGGPDSPGPSLADRRAEQDWAAESDSPFMDETMLRDRAIAEYNRDVAKAGGDPGPSISADTEGYGEWSDYLSPTGYQGIQDSARFNQRQGAEPSKMVAPLIDLIHEKGLSRKGGEGWRYTSLDHLPPEARDKIIHGEPVTVKEPGFLSVGHVRIASEAVGHITHPGGDAAELHVTVKTDKPALDVRQNSGAVLRSIDQGAQLVGEWNFEPGTRMRFTGEHHTEHRAIPYDPSITAFDVRDIEVYEVEIV